MSKCDKCPGACCRYIKIGVQPMTPDRERWARLHGVVIEGDRWAVPAACLELTPAGKCGIYEQRPEVCREFEAGGAGCKAARERMKGTDNAEA